MDQPRLRVRAPEDVAQLFHALDVAPPMYTLCIHLGQAEEREAMSESEYTSMRVLRETRDEVARLAGHERISMMQLVARAIAAYALVASLKEKAPERKRLEVRA